MSSSFWQSRYQSWPQSTPSERKWAMVMHASALGIFIVPGIGHILIPWIIWFINKDDSLFLDDTGRAVLNFQISLSILLIISAILTIVLIGFLITPLLFLAAFIFMIVGIRHAKNGEAFYYPFSWKFL